MFEGVLVANRGEIAVRVIRACRELGVRSVAVFSEADRDAPHTRLADEAHLLGPAPPAASYLNVERLLAVAREAGVDAIHPGYGFLAENADFAAAVTAVGLSFIGPPSEAIRRMGDKLSARQVAVAAGVPVVPGTLEPLKDPEEAIAFGDAHGYPVAVKAMFGGGGRGMKVVCDPAAMREAIEAARREAEAAFGRGECYLERYLDRPRHVEVQVLGALDGRVIHLGERDCSLQRRHQKLIEEAPAPGLADHVRQALGAAGIRVAQAVDYHNAGTCEFLLEEDGETFYFLEMNTRLQVEHPVTELVTGVDLVQEQLRIAAGDGLRLRQEDVRVTGHAIEARINAEDPGVGFVPSPGTVTRLVPPQGPGVRFDTGAESGHEIPREYDSMIAKLVVWAEDRAGARARLRRALEELVVEGVPTTVPFHRLAVDHEQFVRGEHATVSVETEWDLTAMPAHHEGQPVAQPHAPAAARTRRDVALDVGGRSLTVAVYGEGAGLAGAGVPRARRSVAGGGTAVASGDVRAPMQGTVVSCAVTEGQEVAAGELVAVLEAMKMEHNVTAHRDGTVTLVGCAAGDFVESGAVLVRIEEA